MTAEDLDDLLPPVEFEIVSSARETLAEETLNAAIPKSMLWKIESDDCIAVVVQVPSADWVEPVIAAARSVRRWGHIVSPDKGARKRPEGGVAALHLAAGESVLGVSHAPERLLPAALVAAADLRIVVRPPDNGVIRRVVRRATNQVARGLPPAAASGLDFLDIVSAIRVGSTAKACVQRMAAAARSMTVVDQTVAEAPLLRDLHGYGAVKDWGMALVAGLDEYRNGRLAFSALDRHLVMASEPGLGKSSFVRSLARTARLPLVVTSVGAWFSTTDGHLNTVIREVDQVFSKASAMGPAILFVDELDSLPDRRTLDSRNRDYWLPIITHILIILDSATSGISSNICVIGATNHPDRIDPALVRPGRLNRIIRIEPPDAAAVAGILRQHLGAELSGVDLTVAAAAAGRASGAQLQGWVKQAMALARSANAPLTMNQLLSVIAPPMRVGEQDQWRIAVHEAAHAVCAHLTWPGSVDRISIIPKSGQLGSVDVKMPRRFLATKAEIEEDIVFTLAGRAGEIACCGTPSSGAGGSRDSDLAIATQLVSSMASSFGLGLRLSYVAPPEDAVAETQFDGETRAWVEKELNRLAAESLRTVSGHRRTIEAVACALRDRRHLDGTQFIAIFDEASGGASPRAECSPGDEGPRAGLA